MQMYQQQPYNWIKQYQIIFTQFYQMVLYNIGIFKIPHWLMYAINLDFIINFKFRKIKIIIIIKFNNFLSSFIFILLYIIKFRIILKQSWKLNFNVRQFKFIEKDPVNAYFVSNSGNSFIN